MKVRIQQHENRTEGIHHESTQLVKQQNLHSLLKKRSSLVKKMVSIGNQRPCT